MAVPTQALCNVAGCDSQLLSEGLLLGHVLPRAFRSCCVYDHIISVDFGDWADARVTESSKDRQRSSCVAVPSEGMLTVSWLASLRTPWLFS